MRIAIFGVGGVGGYFGSRLAQAGEDVIFIARGEHLKAMKENGLFIDSVRGGFSLNPVNATDNPESVGHVDVVIVGVKAWQVEAVAQSMKPLIGSNTFVVPLQNGVESPMKLSSVLDSERVLGGVCRTICYIEKPGYIKEVGADPYIAFGELNNVLSDRTERLRQAFEKTTGVTAEVPSDIQVAMWTKFLSISSWSGMGAITRVSLSGWRDQPETRQMWQQAMKEVHSVAQVRKIALSEEVIEKATQHVDSLPPDTTASMQRDIINGRPSELDTMNGSVVRFGIEAGIETPVHYFIYYSLLPNEKKIRAHIC